VTKTVSVIIPTYKRTEELKRSIKTVINQTYPELIEIIIIDDSPKQINKEFFQNFSKEKNRKIKYIYKGKKEGAPKARNIGIQEAKGEYIAFLDDDDEWHPKKTEKQVKTMEKNNNIGLVICYSLDKRFGKERISKPPEKISHETILKAFNLSSSSSYLVRKNILEKTGYFDTNLPSAQEYDLAIRISKHYLVYCIPEVLMTQNTTKDQISENWNRKIKGLMGIYSKHRQEYHSIKTFDRFLNHIKFIGMLELFTLGYIIGNRIYSIIIPAKEIYEK